MKPVFFLFLSLFLCAASVSYARLEPGDSVSKMRLELGEPTGEILRGTTTIYSYPQGGVHVRDGRVVRLSEGFYGSADQIIRQSGESSWQRNLSETNHGAESSGGATSAPEARQSDTGLSWYSDWKQASEVAVQEQRPLLVVISSAEDCSSCREWERHFRSPEFVHYAQDFLVLLWFEAPQLEGSSSAGEIFPDGEPLQQRPVSTIPELRVFAPDLSEIGWLGYEPMQTTEFVEAVHGLFELDPETAEKWGRSILEDEFGDTLDRLLWIEGISGSAILLSAQIFAGCVLTFLLIRRWMRK